jgi:hypothetical protein
MAVSVTLDQRPKVVGDEMRSRATVTLDSSYPTGGEPLTPRELGLRYVNFALCTVSAVGGSVNVAQVHYDKANEKLKLFDETPAEVANAADVSGIKVQVIAFGKP